jgi:hypothetical protein
MKYFLILFFLLIQLPAQESEHVKPNEFILEDKNLQIEVWATSPMLLNPTSLDIDKHNNIWVTEAVNYRNFKKNPKLNFPEGDRIVVLQDTNNDGKADKSQIFVQDNSTIKFSSLAHRISLFIQMSTAILFSMKEILKKFS